MTLLCAAHKLLVEAICCLCTSEMNWRIKCQFMGSGWAIIRIIVKTCRRTVKPQSDADLSFSRDEIAIKRTNAQISGMQYLKWDTSNYLEARNASCTSQEETRDESLNMRQFKILLQVANRSSCAYFIRDVAFVVVY